MLSNYLKIAFRNLVKNKVYSFINIGGLAVGMAIAMLIGLWVYDELSFNKYHKNYDRVAKVMMKSTDPGTQVTKSHDGLWEPVENILKTSYGQYFEKVATVWHEGEMTLTYSNKKFVRKGNFIGQDVLDILSMEMIYGDVNSLKKPNAVVISDHMAQAVFGNQNPVNKQIKIDNQYDLVVTGVYKKFPKNTTYGDLDIIASFEDFRKRFEWVQNAGWNSSAYNFIIKLSPKVTINQADNGFADLMLRFGPQETRTENAKYKPTFYLFPMSNWHLYSEFENGIPATGRIVFLWMFGLIGLFVLILACINFMNLSTARSEHRAKEIGVRKAVGSMKNQLVTQFFTESYLVVFLAFVLALSITFLSLSSFNDIADKSIVLPWKSSGFWVAIILFIVTTGFLSGIYPAFYLSSFNPLKILRGTFKAGRFAAIPRKALVVVQFTVSVALIIGTSIVYKQIIFAQSRAAGYTKEGIVSVSAYDPNYVGKYEVLKNELLKTNMVSKVAYSFSPLTGIWENIGGFRWEGKTEQQKSNFAFQWVDSDYGKTIDWKITQGRDFSNAFADDSTSIIINEAAVAYMGIKQPIGKIIRDEKGEKSYTILGVVKDIVMSSPFEPVKQTFFVLDKNHRQTSNVHLKLADNISPNAALPKLESVFKRIVPTASFNYKFVDEDYDAKFKSEQTIATLASIFAILAVFISCLGLFGLASFVAEQRTKEIGIRKVLGASVANLWQMLSKDFVILVLISCLIAAPITFYFMNEWLQKYTYRTEISWWIFAAAGAGALVITLLTVSYQAIKTALMDPVKSLKSE
jgi:putative ABC transport system permease protein